MTDQTQQQEASVEGTVSTCTKSKLEHAFEECNKNGGKELNLSSLNLKAVPTKTFDYCNTLELLNLGNNDLDSLPDEFYRLRKLRILFFANNKFRCIPSVLGQLLSLFMLSFKSNNVQEIPPDSLSSSIEWLILTDNQISTLPPTIGKLTNLKKCMLAGNKLTTLPMQMSNCQQLELLRIASNEIADIPDWLLHLPKLTWLAAGGNPVFPAAPKEDDHCVNHILASQLTLLQLLGEGASGYVYRAIWSRPNNTEEEVAVKVFKGAVTSDGLPTDELSATLQLAVYAARHWDTSADYPITPILGVIIGSSLCMDVSANEKDVTCSSITTLAMPAGGLVMKLIPSDYKLLGSPPSFKTITRDTFDPTVSKLSPLEACDIVLNVAHAMMEVHDAKLCHGDLYAHNLLVCRMASDEGQQRPLISV